MTASTRTRAPFSRSEDVDLFLEKLGQFERGEISADAWRAFRLLNGTYGQRQEGDLSMLRVKIPQGVLEAAQLRALAEVADRWSRGFCHLTTRQNVQFHFVKLAEVEPAMRLIADAGVTTKEACGNSVRNITCCPRAGVAKDEVFDPTPYGEALTRHLLRHPLSSTLPRKFKMAFEGCPEDHALTSIHDLGFRARISTEGGAPRRGFEVRAGGGTATLPTSARVLVDFLPADDILALAEAVLAVFHRMGERKNKNAARMKWLIRKIGWDAFRAEFETELAAVRARGAPHLPFPPDDPPAEAAPAWERP
ncbi:MAG TPA: nitrite/sulfite reductase, partial [Myxococcales bacterium]